MVKVLFCGNLNKEWKLFDQKITNLTNSIHGPFDLVICCGIFFNNEESYQEYLHENINLPIPVYIFDHGNFLKNKVLPTNIYLLASVGAIIFQDLVIASYITNGDILYPEEYQKLLNSIKEIRYDILITSEWPQGFTNLLPISELHQLSEVGYVASNTAGSGQIIAELAATLRPRYHISSSLENPIFYQRLPYAQLSTPYSSAFPSIPWFTRFIGLASVSSSKEKHLKWIHALALDPISAPNTTHVSLVADLAQPHTPCPYAMLDTSAARSDEPPPKKIKNDLSNSTQNPGSFFFGEMAVPRSHKSAPKNTLLTPPSSDSKTLFFGGLPVPKSYGNKPTSLEGDIRRQFDGVVSFRQPNGKAFAFVEFDTPENAQRVVAMSQESPGVVIKGNPLTIGWAADSNNQNSSRISGLPVISPAILSPPTLDSKTLFVGGLPPCEEALDSQFESSLRQELISLFPGCVNVKRISHKSFAFLEFESHIQATTVMLAYSENNEAYQITDPGDSSKKRRLALGWSKGDNHQINQPQNGPQNNDCWFCLASPNVKVSTSHSTLPLIVLP